MEWKMELSVEFDGHGKNGHIVSKINALAKTYTAANDSTFQNHVERIDGELRPSKNFHIWKEACISAFKLMDKEVQLQKKLDSSCSGTTAVVVIRQDEDLIIANLGDSRAVLGTITNNGVTAIQLTTDLKPGLPCEAERIRNCNGRAAALRQEPHVQRVWLPHDDSPGLAMSRAIGDFILKNHGIIAIPNIYYHCVTSNDQFIILATDESGMCSIMIKLHRLCGQQIVNRQQQAVVEAATATWKKRYPCAKVDDCTATCLFLQKKQHFIVPVET
ncbi:putative protein phosphatase 2c 72 [Quercus suber]|uniref:PPM-type phosphatase domain-containing protein n=1 Tax=Quercus suber TaxID=58331 RepID=A0AAW0IFW9_QUESU